MSTETENLPIDNIIDDVRALLEAEDSSAAVRLLAPLHPSDISMLVERLEEALAIKVFGLLDADVASETLLELDGHLREVIVASMSSDDLVEVVDEMATDDKADVISELPSEDAKKVLEGIEWKEAKVVQKLLRYPEDTAGGKMQAELVAISESATVGETIEEVRKRTEDVENIACVFVLDSESRLRGAVSLDKLILARVDEPIKAIADTNIMRVKTSIDQEEVGRMFQRYDLLSLAVVDDEERLVGRITVDDMVDVIESEIFEDFYRMASLNKGERALDPPRRSFRMRSPWLLLNLLTAFAAASVVKVFESTIESLVILAVLMPVVAGLGGNAATQTVTVLVRGLALGEFELRGAKKILIKEALVGLSNGLLIGAVAAIASVLFGADYMIGLLLFLAMTASLLIAGLGGATIPLILKWLKVDPALSATIFVTACTDIGGFFTFLGLAALFMKLGLI